MKHILIGLIILLAACNNNKNTSKANRHAQCYQYSGTAGTITMRLEENDFFSGILVYELKEKDRNGGTIQGKLQGDLLIADYSFVSEGSLSVRQVAFKKIGNNFIEGYGDVVVIDNKAVFKDISTLQFNSDMVLSVINCQ
jgi:hypothetical protein